MKEKIYTIPVNDAYAAAGRCPLCTLEATMTGQLLEYYLGPALMEPDVRKATNDKGFCREHLRAPIKGQSHHGATLARSGRPLHKLHF